MDVQGISSDAVSREEIRKVLKTLKSGKATGLDSISVEELKADPETTITKLHRIFEMIWERDEVPQDWKESLIVKIPKKGDLSKCGNWRGISLLSVPSKILGRIIIDRIRDGVDNPLRKEQAGFRKNRGTTEQIFILRNIVEQSIEWNASLYINFLDFEKAFDSLKRVKLWKILRNYGIPGKLVNIIKELYNGSECSVLDKRNITDWFQVKDGVRQGCAMSGFLFVIAIDWVMKEATRDKGRGIRWRFTTTLEDLDYADDIALVSSRFQDIQEKTTRVDKTARSVGLKINQGESKVLRINNRNENPVAVDGRDLEDVQKFVYLGAEVNTSGGTEEDIKRRITLARGAFIKLNKLWNSGNLRIKTKLRLFNSNVMSVLLYSADTWMMTEGSAKKIDTFQRKCLRRIFKIRWPEKISNEDLYRKAHSTPVSCIIKSRRWKLIGHVLRRDDAHDTKVALTWTPEGRRKRGRPKTTWRRTVERERDDFGWASWGEARNTANDRAEWRLLWRSLMRPPGHEEDR